MTRVAVIGAGVIGLAVARRLAMTGKQVMIFEQHAGPGQEISGHNSEIIHAGIYYITGSLKAQLAVRGRDLLYDYCARKNIAHRKCGKLIIATDEAQHVKLQALEDKARANGVDNMMMLSAADITARVPEACGTAALFSPATGILSVKQLMAAMLEDADADIHFNTKVTRIAANPAGGFDITANGETYACDQLVNAAGLYATDIIDAFDDFPAAARVQTYFAKGNYFRLAAPMNIPHLLYPLPEPGGLGIHLTFDLNGNCRFGPDVEWVNEINYDVNPAHRNKFCAEIQKYLPNVTVDGLVPYFAGVRPKVVPEGGGEADFIIQDEVAHGIPGLVNLFGIESPGLTSCLSIADDVAEKLN